MTRWFGPILIVMGILCGTCAWAQNDTGNQDTGTQTQPGPKPAFTYPDTTPSLDFLSQAAENSSITLGIGAGASYYSNAYSNGTAGQNYWFFSVGPSIKIQKFLPKLSWYISYSPSYQTYSYQNGPANPNNPNSALFGQSASAGFLWQMAPHWQLKANDGFTYSANPFTSFLTTVGTPTMNNPNPVSYYPLTQYTLNGATLTLTHQLTKLDTLSFTGTENLRRTSNFNVVNSAPFYNLTSYGGRASYAHQMSRRLTLGAGYDYNSLDFGRGQQRSGIQTISMTVDYQIRPNMSISGWVGPQYTGTKTVLAVPVFGQIVYFTTHDSMWSTALGANFGWRGRRDSISAGFIRQVMDGGGITATSEVNAVTASYRRMLMPKMNLTLGTGYGHDISITTSSRSYDNYSVGATLDYKLAKSLLASAQYGFIHQNQSNAFLLGPGTYNTNRVGVTVSYTWIHPLGR